MRNKTLFLFSSVNLVLNTWMYCRLGEQMDGRIAVGKIQKISLPM